MICVYLATIIALSLRVKSTLQLSGQHIYLVPHSFRIFLSQSHYMCYTVWILKQPELGKVNGLLEGFPKLYMSH